MSIVKLKAQNGLEYAIDTLFRMKAISFLLLKLYKTGSLSKIICCQSFNYDKDTKTHYPYKEEISGF